MVAIIIHVVCRPMSCTVGIPTQTTTHALREGSGDGTHELNRKKKLQGNAKA